MHAREHRLGGVAQGDDRVMQFGGKRFHHGRQVRQVGMKQCDIAAREKCRAIAAQYDHAHRRIVARLFAHRAQPHDHVRIKRVHDLRPVKRDGRYAIGHCIGERFSAHSGISKKRFAAHKRRKRG